MVKRKDGQATRQKLLDTACRIFAEKGFREAKVTDICRQAGANVAAINYYFGDKDSLYIAAWRQAMERFIAADDPLPESLSPSEQLRFAIHRIIRKIFIPTEDSGQFRQMELMELANPSGLIEETWKEVVAPRKQEMIQLVRNFIGPEASEDAVKLCEMSIVNQCRGYILMQKNGLELSGEQVQTPDRVNQIAEHITQFSIAGIKAIMATHP